MKVVAIAGNPLLSTSWLGSVGHQRKTLINIIETVLSWTATAKSAISTFHFPPRYRGICVPTPESDRFHVQNAHIELNIALTWKSIWFRYIRLKWLKYLLQPTSICVKFIIKCALFCCIQKRIILYVRVVFHPSGNRRRRFFTSIPFLHVIGDNWWDSSVLSIILDEKFWWQSLFTPSTSLKPGWP